MTGHDHVVTLDFIASDLLKDIYAFFLQNNTFCMSTFKIDLTFICAVTMFYLGEQHFHKKYYDVLLLEFHNSSI